MVGGTPEACSPSGFWPATPRLFATSIPWLWDGFRFPLPPTPQEQLSAATPALRLGVFALPVVAVCLAIAIVGCKVTDRQRRAAAIAVVLSVLALPFAAVLTIESIRLLSG
jgi:hypothetical protein